MPVKPLRQEASRNAAVADIAALHPIDGRRYIGFLISDVARLMRAAFDRRVRRLGLTRSQWQVLSLLYRRPGVSQAELAELLEVEPAPAGRMIDRLERKAWLVRRPDPGDRRVNRIFLTTEAESVQAEMGLIATEMLDDAMASLGGAERDVLVELLERMKGQLQAMGSRPEAAAREAAALTVPRRAVGRG
jgi:DNA-binding MarR family transcriptional regulator